MGECTGIPKQALRGLPARGDKAIPAVAARSGWHLLTSHFLDPGSRFPDFTPKSVGS